jgi:hypothetical protein
MRPPGPCWIAHHATDLARRSALPSPDPRLATPQTLQIPDWCGCSTEYLAVPTRDGWWQLVPIWDPDQTPNPLRRFEPAVPYWAADL